MEPGGFVDNEEVVGESVFEDIGHDDFWVASASSFFFSADDKVEDEGETEEEEEEDGRGEEEEEEAAEDDVNGRFEVGEDLVGEVFGCGLLTAATVSSICLASCFFAFFLAFFCCC